MKDWKDIYLFEVSFFGIKRKVSQGDEDLTLSKLAIKYGHGISRISLIPQCSGYSKITFPIPRNSIPLYFRRIVRDFAQGNLMSLVFCIGYEIKNVRFLLSVDIKTGNVEVIMERSPSGN